MVHFILGKLPFSRVARKLVISLVTICPAWISTGVYHLLRCHLQGITTIVSWMVESCLFAQCSSSSSSSWSTWNLLLRDRLNSSFVFGSFRTLTLYLRLSVLSHPGVLKLPLELCQWWSEATSAPVFTRKSCTDVRNHLATQMWSIWFSVLWSGYTYVALWISR